MGQTESVGLGILNAMPKEVLLYICQFVPHSSLSILESTCTALRLAIEEESQAACLLKEKKKVSNMSWAMTLALKVVYTCDRNRHEIRRGYWLEGCDFMKLDVLLMGLDSPKGVTVYKNKLYWAERFQICRCTLDAFEILPQSLSSLPSENVATKLGGNDLSGPNTLEVYNDTLYWGNTDHKNLVSLTDFESLSAKASKNEGDSASDETEDSVWIEEDNRWLRKPSDLPVDAKYTLLSRGQAVHGITYVPEHDWILWFDWSRDLLTIITRTEGTELYVSPRIGMLL